MELTKKTPFVPTCLMFVEKYFDIKDQAGPHFKSEICSTGCLEFHFLCHVINANQSLELVYLNICVRSVLVSVRVSLFGECDTTGICVSGCDFMVPIRFVAF